MLPPQGSGLPNGHAGKGYSGGLGAFDRKTIDREDKADKEMAGFGDLLARVEQLEKVSIQYTLKIEGSHSEECHNLEVGPRDCEPAPAQLRAPGQGLRR